MLGLEPVELVGQLAAGTDRPAPARGRRRRISRGCSTASRSSRASSCRSAPARPTDCGSSSRARAISDDVRSPPSNSCSSCWTSPSASSTSDELRIYAERDSLTGLLNRRRFDEELQRAVAESQRYGTPATLLVCDLDNIKLVNDTLGHKAGDELIKAVARRARRASPRDRRARADGRRRVRGAADAHRASSRRVRSPSGCAQRCSSSSLLAGGQRSCGRPERRDRADRRRAERRGVAGRGRPRDVRGKAATGETGSQPRARRCRREMPRALSSAGWSGCAARSGRGPLRAACAADHRPAQPARCAISSCCCGCASKTASC